MSRLSELSGNFARKTLIGLQEPVTNSHMLPMGSYLSQSLALKASSAMKRFIIWNEDQNDMSQGKICTQCIHSTQKLERKQFSKVVRAM